LVKHFRYAQELAGRTQDAFTVVSIAPRNPNTKLPEKLGFMLKTVKPYQAGEVAFQPGDKAYVNETGLHWINKTEGVPGSKVDYIEITPEITQDLKNILANTPGNYQLPPVGSKILTEQIKVDGNWRIFKIITQDKAVVLGSIRLNTGGKSKKVQVRETPTNNGKPVTTMILDPEYATQTNLPPETIAAATATPSGGKDVKIDPKLGKITSASGNQSWVLIKVNDDTAGWINEAQAKQQGAKEEFYSSGPAVPENHPWFRRLKNGELIAFGPDDPSFAEYRISQGFVFGFDKENHNFVAGTNIKGLKMDGLSVDKYVRFANAVGILPKRDTTVAILKLDDFVKDYNKPGIFNSVPKDPKNYGFIVDRQVLHNIESWSITDYKKTSSLFAGAMYLQNQYLNRIYASKEGYYTRLPGISQAMWVGGEVDLYIMSATYASRPDVSLNLVTMINEFNPHFDLYTEFHKSIKAEFTGEY
jgi:hypothetical protein